MPKDGYLHHPIGGMTPPMDKQASAWKSNQDEWVVPWDHTVAMKTLK